MKPLRAALVALVATAGAFAAEPLGSTRDLPSVPRYLDPAQPLEGRVQDLVSRLTLEEKTALTKNTTPGVPRLGIPKYDWWNEALHGVARAGEATVFPQAIGMAAMWDEALMRQIAHTIGIEARAKFNGAAGTRNEGERYYGLTFWTPNINIFRDPRWGRGQETYGEDPFLTARTGVAFVCGLQGDDPRYLLAAGCAKHFAVHSGPESLRHNFDVAPSAADFHETYLPAFEALVREAKVETVMMAYNSVYGRPAAVNPRLYLLLAQWGFNGHITSDCGAIADLSRTYKLAADEAGGEALALKAGLDLRCGDEPSQLVTAVKRGLISEAELDYRLGALLRTQFRLGFYDPPASVPFRRIAPAENLAPAHAALALKAARESMVLLKNDGTLPLSPRKLKRVAVIGPSADSVAVLLGNYNGQPVAPVTVLAGLKAALGDKVEIEHVRGCDHVAQPAGPVTISGANLSHGAGSGLQIEIFPNADLAGEPAGKWQFGALQFDWTGNPRAAAPFSARWTGDLVANFAGDYELTLAGCGGFRLFLRDEPVVSAWDETGAATRSFRRHFAAGERIPLRVEYHHTTGPVRLAFKWTAPPSDTGFADAVAAANRADAVVFVGGISAQLEGEEMTVDYEGFKGGDRTRIELPTVQQQLLEKLAATGKPLVFVNLSGSAMAMPWADAHVNAILQGWYPGQAAGTAVADVLFGNYNPAGRLPVTFYRATADLPAFEDYAMAGRTYRYFKGRPLYAFGHGLSYTTFAYAHLKVTPGADQTLSVAVDLTNTGGRDGDEVVQLYGVPPAARENEALCGFVRVNLKAGETKTVTLAVPVTALRRWSVEKDDYIIPGGEWEIRAGASSADIRQTAKVKL